MSKHKDYQVSEIDLEGRFLGFAAKEGYKLKYLRLATATGEQVVKIPKDLRSMLYRTLTPGEWVHVTGEQKHSYKQGTIKLKAHQIYPITPSQLRSAAPLVSSPPAKPSTKQETILVCQKSDCCKRGGRALADALKTELSDRGLDDRVAIKPTGCMKQCKAGPNLVMPDKTRYCRIGAKDVSSLVDKHFSSQVATPT
ncbi:MAG: OB-fold nucleic acid binding domain-containing protein [Elainellaceae cyanobacterium]